MGMHGYIDAQLLDNEEVVYRGHLSWVPIILRIIPLYLIGCAGGGAVWGLTGNLGLGLLAIFAGIVVGILLQITSVLTNIGTDIVITNKRLHSKKGIISVRENQASNLSRIDDTNVRFDTWLKRFFKYGDVTVNTLGEGEFSFINMSKPQSFKLALHDAKDYYANWGERTPMSVKPIEEEKPIRANDEERAAIPVANRSQGYGVQ